MQSAKDSQRPCPFRTFPSSFPVYNEAGNIAGVVREVRLAFDRLVGYEIVLVDDGSDDGTAGEIAAQVAAAAGIVRAVTHATRGGKSRALINGAKAARGRFMATMDGDGQDDPANLVRMWQKLCESGEPDPRLLVCGWRTERKDGFWRKFVSRIANRVRRWLLGDGTPDTACGLKLMNREAFLELPHFENMHRFFPALFAQARAPRGLGSSDASAAQRGRQQIWHRRPPVGRPVGPDRRYVGAAPDALSRGTRGPGIAGSRRLTRRRCAGPGSRRAGR